ncbi:transposase [Tamlana haliotis]|uniref:Transposase n=1 Tax=Pseudotamlana haliotis TaxID=2614804 RepID=A0A6N6MNY8_9FLAO|nr:transposase [Tamlana haliotis]
MKTSANNGTPKRTQKDYSLSFKLQLVEEIEQGFLTKSQAKLKYGIQGDSTVTKWLQKYGNFDWENQLPSTRSKTPEQRILELEAKVKLLEKQKERAEHPEEQANKKVIIFDMLVDMAKKEYDEQTTKLKKKTV